jgi:RNA polymerase sigma-70 factor (ECF subfamily)
VGHEQRALMNRRTVLARGGVRDDVPAERSIDPTSPLERETAFRRLAESHIEASYRLANAILGDPAESRDAVHDAFIKAWERWPSLRDATKFEWWFKRIVVNTCRNRLRDASKRRTSDIATEATVAIPDQAGPSVDRVVVEQALATLRPDDRVVLALRYFHDLKLEDIAAVLDVPTGTVKSRLNHAHARLREAVDRSPRGSL